MKKNLIYFIAFGDFYYREMVKLSILSILDLTNYEGDIVVLTDSEGIPMNDRIRNRVKTIDVQGPIPIKNRYNIFCLKSFIQNYINLLDYKYCLYLDGDILINYKNLNELFDFFASMGKLQVSDNDGWTVSKNQWSTGSQVLTPEEKIKYGNFGACAGIVGIPCNELGLEFLNDWQQYNRAGNWEIDDQGNFTALLLRKYRNNFEWMPFLNKNRNNLRNITHYCSGNSKHLFWNHSKFLLSNYYKQLPSLEGSWIMNKPGESLQNTWYFKNGLVYVDNPMIVGHVQDTEFGKYIWWSTLDGFELIKFKDNSIDCNSFRGGKFTLIKSTSQPNDVLCRL